MLGGDGLRHFRLALVTGSAGFIGSHLAEELLSAGWGVRGVDTFTRNYAPARKYENVVPLAAHPDFEQATADLCAAPLEPLLEGIDTVFHLAAEPGVTGSWGNAFARYSARNLLATQRLAEAALQAGVRRFVYASSSSVYGDGVVVPTQEDAPLRPSSPYGVTKAAAELLLGAYATEHGLPVVTLRYFSVYGPRQRPDMAMHRFIEAALRSQPVVVYGTGRQQRDFTFVDDAVRATVAAALVAAAPGAVVNVASGSTTTILAVLDLVRTFLGEDMLVVDHRPARPGDVSHTEACIRRARQVLNWEPRIGLQSGLATQIEWHLRKAPASTAQRARFDAVRNSGSPGTATQVPAGNPA